MNLIQSRWKTFVARVSVPEHLVAVAGRTLCAVESELIRGDKCSTVQRPLTQASFSHRLYNNLQSPKSV